MALIGSAMRDLEIPGHAWRRDTDAERKFRDFNRQLDELIAGQGERDIEVQQLTSEIKHIERRLAEATGRRHELTVVVPNTISGYSQRIGQLRSEHPRLFHSIDDVVRERIAAKARKSASFRADWGP
jgi:chromosome segregation ATPase